MSQNKPEKDRKPPVVIARPKGPSKEDLKQLALDLFRSITGKEPTAQELEELEEEVQNTPE